jgi:hypothetical protein
MFLILKHLQPGNIWSSCRAVSRSWKLHVDVNIERYYANGARQLKQRRDLRLGPQSPFDNELRDSIVMDIITWSQSPASPGIYSEGRVVIHRFLFQLRHLDIPNYSSRREGIKMANWEERATFELTNIAHPSMSVLLARPPGELEPPVLLGEYIRVKGIWPCLYSRTHNHAYSESLRMDRHSLALIPGNHQAQVGPYSLKYRSERVSEKPEVSKIYLLEISVLVRDLFTRPSGRPLQFYTEYIMGCIRPPAQIPDDPQNCVPAV